ncbi:protein of unknown function (DUF4457) [Carpediemonas membranifera]|uniref:KATNIP domain-containing protein n=1 Tax=Carpediemonas membranifera TaxID=201153 RepID=A0A8J6B2M0_9EUKA|nr:protein of unknown function (DUF4457) [Carpediemonas membranifera]|eukprot:KAG9391589.1 protein of unknown function (DUF4457) [Carpediemonas membranifera]
MQELNDIYNALNDEMKTELLHYARNLLNRSVSHSLSDNRLNKASPVLSEPEKPKKGIEPKIVGQYPSNTTMEPLRTSTFANPAESSPKAECEDPLMFSSDSLDMTTTVALAAGDEDLPLEVTGHVEIEEEEIGIPHVKARTLTIRVLSTWGDEYYYGLTGLRVLLADGTVLPLPAKAIQPTPRDLNIMEGYGGDSRTPDKLVDGKNVTTDDTHMWLAPATLDDSKPQLIVIKLDQPETRNLALPDGRFAVSGIRLWNYNKNVEDTTRGVRDFLLFADDEIVTGPAGWQLRKALGTSHVDFGQTFVLASSSPITDVTPTCTMAPNLALKGGQMVKLPCEVVQALPTMLTLTIWIRSTYGDPRTVSLGGIEVYNKYGNQVMVDDDQVRVGTYPGDSAKAVELFAGKPWAAEFGARGGTRIDLLFEDVFTLSLIKIMNNAKTPISAARDVQIMADDRLIFEGTLIPVVHDNPNAVNSVLFTADPLIQSREAQTVVGGYGPPEFSSHWHRRADMPIQPVRFINQHKEVNLPRYMGDAARPIRGLSAPTSDAMGVTQRRGTQNRPESVNRMVYRSRR